AAKLLALCLAATAALHAATITLESPSAYQVFQRETKKQGKVVVRGHSSETCDAAEFRLTGASVSISWISLLVEGGCAFSGEVRAPAGGWYSVEVRLLRHGEAAGSIGV